MCVRYLDDTHMWGISMYVYERMSEQIRIYPGYITRLYTQIPTQIGIQSYIFTIQLNKPEIMFITKRASE